ncbi:MAG: hypothetical protein S4CHLAM7_04840 [Chlamydiae bacterium]|nr:hypothetical protein [Chlamydiota bacterium]
MKTKSSYDWVSYVERAILDLDDIPLLGKIPTFPWDSFAQSLGSFLGIEGLKIRSSQWHWYSSETLAENLGDSLTCLNFSALPVQGKVSFLLPELDAYSLVHWLVQKKAKTHSVLNSQFASGLLTYLSVEALSHLQKQSFFDGFLLRYLSEDSPPSVRCLGVDVLFEACGETLTGRLLIPEVFRKSWMTHFLERPKHLTKEMSQNIRAFLFFRGRILLSKYSRLERGKEGRFYSC